ncbi:MAG: hypothetical protein Q4D37_05960 [Oscillospiraceae bacterium]|nr:hypothetical protein [Oscillospiraceae bacterium]
MALKIQILKCEQCGGDIIPLKHSSFLPGGAVQAKCVHCGTPYALSSEHANVESSYVTTVFDKEIRNGYEWMHVQKDYAYATAAFEKATHENPADYRGFWGLVNANSKELEDHTIGKSQFSNVETNFQRAYTAAKAHEDEAVAEKLQGTWNAYKDCVREYWNTKGKEIEEKRKKITENEREMACLSKDVEKLNRKRSKKVSLPFIFAEVLCIIIFAFIIGISGIPILASLFVPLIAVSVVGSIYSKIRKKKLETLYAKKQGDRYNISDDTANLKSEVYEYDSNAVV